ncbi:DUF805 domain-containing protein [Oceanicoccus sagamiensis]|uniref:DUF805 domain-containing protein n=1 Tax=Oceanicoccus sagamiensis TaxID=716816 RepID=A0A1X9NJJ3_9GAMM|nr:DUF805 domain-containing protein [Oceanicoccus sagamiensis]ARN76015.1 hypothetical protein BST96_19100 [Oceanicoccus sagamiensis]
MNSYIDVLKKYAVFGGRSRRKEYWYFVLFNLILTIVIGVIDQATGTFDPETGMGLIGILYALVVIIPSFAVLFRRLHDTGRSAWWLLILLVPLIGFLVVLFFLCQDSEAGPNRWGEPPK